jgi:3-methyladenine DNA glycosylase AlkD
VNIKKVHQHFINQIELNVEHEIRDRMLKSIPTQHKLYGVRIPKLRQIAKEWYKKNKNLGFKDFVEIIGVLWKDKSREERTIAIELLNFYKEYIPDISKDLINEWIISLDNWEETDGFALYLVGRWMLDSFNDRQSYLWELIEDENEWLRRVAVVATIEFNDWKKDNANPELTFKLIDVVKEDKHPMITKAVSWAIRTLIKEHKSEVATYMEKNNSVLAKHIVREVNNKLTSGLKNVKQK